MTAYDRYTTSRQTDIREHYSEAGYSVPKGGTVFLKQAMYESGFGINLSNPAIPYSAWVDVRFRDHPDRDGEWGSDVEASLVNPESTRRFNGVGRTALLDVVRLDVGDSFVVGRKKYPGISEYVSSKHVRLEVVGFNQHNESGIGLKISDLASRNGTRLFVPQTVYDFEEPTTNPPDYQQPPEDTGFFRPAEYEHVTGLSILKHKYGSTYPDLGDIEFAICLYACNDLRARRGNLDDRQFLREFNKALHPDRHPDIAPGLADCMYKLCHQELGL